MDMDLYVRRKRSDELMARKNDRVCVPGDYPVERIKANRMYIVRYCNSLFIANGKIYVNIRKDDDDEKFYCCTIHNFKKWGGIENLKRFVSLKGRKEVKTIADLMDAVIECGYSRELDYFEYMDIENDSLLENSDYKYSIDDCGFCECKNLVNGFSMNMTGFRESGGEIFHDGHINFCLDLSNRKGGIRKDLPECVLKEIEHEANRLLEANIVNPNDVKKVKFTCYAKVQLYHSMRKDGRHIFYRSYSIHIEIDKIGEYYNDLDNVDMKFLKHAKFCLCDISGTEKPFDEFIRDEIFANIGI